MNKKFLIFLVLMTVMVLTFLIMKVFPTFEDWLHQLTGWY